MDKKEYTGELVDLSELDKELNGSTDEGINQEEINIDTDIDSEVESEIIADQDDTIENEPIIDTNIEKGNKTKKWLRALGATAVTTIFIAASAVGINIFGNSKDSAAKTPTEPQKIEDTQASHDNSSKSETTAKTNTETGTSSSSNSKVEEDNTGVNEDKTEQTNNSIPTTQVSEAKSNAELESNIEDLRIDSELLKTNPKKVAELFDQNFLIRIANAGATKENAEKATESGDIRKYMAIVADETEQPIIEQYIDQNSMSNPNIISFLERVGEYHENTITYAAASADPSLDRTDKEMYALRGEVTGLESVQENTDGSTTIGYTGKEYDNGTKTHFLKSMVTSEEVLIYVTFKDNNGHLLVTDIDRRGVTGN